MGKLVLTVAVAAGAWFGVGALGAPTWARVVCAVLGAVVFNALWNRIVIDPYDYLGALPVASDDPLMNHAKERARETLPEFRELYPRHVQDSMVKFRFVTDTDAVEYLWGDLLELRDDTAKVYLRTPPMEHKGALDRTQEVPTDAIVDWQIELQDGSIRGGFTNRVMFKIYERELGEMHPKFERHFQRFLDS